MSIVSVSQPWCAITSAEKPLGIASQPLTACLFCCHNVRRRFSLTGFSSVSFDAPGPAPDGKRAGQGSRLADQLAALEERGEVVEHALRHGGARLDGGA